MVLAEDLQRCSVQSCEDAGRRFCFRVVTPTRSCTFQADCEAGRRAWISAIQNLTEREEGTVKSEEESDGYEDDSKSDSSKTLVDGEIQLEDSDSSEQTDSQGPRASSKAPGGISSGEVVCDAPENKNAEGEPAEEEPAEGDPGEGETTKEETTKGETGEGEPGEGEPSEGKTTKGETGEGEPAEEEPGEGETAKEETTKGETGEGEPGEGEPGEGKTTKGETAKGEPAEGEPGEGKTAKEETTKGETGEREPAKGEPAEGETTDGGRQEEVTTDTNPNSFESQYTVGELLGKGGCGSVYEGIHKVDGNQVAIKYVVKDEDLRFTRIVSDFTFQMK
ncbi:uncharacterized protein LOC134326310 [Trichomycterus rosablanca]|uniref:uncharacterized protein LOC134305440 n=1 Tax=Trichomycterus rosablanca TaxID=2290929 RepID=UPI002F35B95D